MTRLFLSVSGMISPALAIASLFSICDFNILFCVILVKIISNGEARHNNIPSPTLFVKTTIMILMTLHISITIEITPSLNNVSIVSTSVTNIVVISPASWLIRYEDSIRLIFLLISLLNSCNTFSPKIVMEDSRIDSLTPANTSVIKYISAK